MIQSQTSIFYQHVPVKEAIIHAYQHSKLDSDNNTMQLDIRGQHINLYR
jgi:hypothetical protein